MKVKMSELKELCEMILTKVELIGCSEIDLPNDYYWFIHSSDREDIHAYNASSKAVLGSLIDDMESLRKVLNGTNPPEINDFDRLGNVVIVVGEAISLSSRFY
jgi:hypothetical protein